MPKVVIALTSNATISPRRWRLGAIGRAAIIAAMRYPRKLHEATSPARVLLQARSSSMTGRIGVYTKRPMPMAAAIAKSPAKAIRIGDCRSPDPASRLLLLCAAQRFHWRGTHLHHRLQRLYREADEQREWRSAFARNPRCPRERRSRITSPRASARACALQTEDPRDWIALRHRLRCRARLQWRDSARKFDRASAGWEIPWARPQRACSTH
jgi:hypothetical protein